MANSLNILQFSDEILLKILRFLPERFDAANSCKKFYELVCEIEKNDWKLSVGMSIDESIFSSIINTHRLFDTLDVCLELKKTEDVDLLKRIFQRHGKGVKKLIWANWCSFELNEGELIEMLSFLPNFEELQMSSWSHKLQEVTGKEKKVLKLDNLQRLGLADCQTFTLEFFKRNLSPNSLRHLQISGMSLSNDLLKGFIEAQLEINSIDFDGSVPLTKSLEALKLTQMRIVMWENEAPLNQRAFLRDLIKSQPNLTSIDTLCDRDYSYQFVDEEVFRAICEIESLVRLRINIDGVPWSCAENFKNLKNLKTLEVKTNLDSSLETLKELSLLENLKIENLFLNLWSFDIPQETYRKFGQNFPLKSLRISLGTHHKLNFYMECFPNIENMSIRFGDANNTVTFNESYDDDGQKHENIKELCLKFMTTENADSELFGKMLKSFPNLEKLRFTSKLPFSNEFFGNLLLNLGKLRDVALNEWYIEEGETFAPEAIESLKKLSKMLTYGKFALRNHEGRNACRRGSKNVIFEPLVEGLKDHYKIKEGGYCIHVTVNTLVLTVGKEENRGDE